MTRPLSQSVRDALADVETLWRVAHEVDDFGRVAYYCREAALCGEEAQANLPERDAIGFEYWGPIHAREAARAAFRAVPGLRGEVGQ